MYSKCALERPQPLLAGRQSPHGGWNAVAIPSLAFPLDMTWGRVPVEGEVTTQEFERFGRSPIRSGTEIHGDRKETIQPQITSTGPVQRMGLSH